MEASIRIVVIAMWLVTVVVLLVVGFLVFRLLRSGRKPKAAECSHIYMLYSPTASRCSLCGQEHPYSNSLPDYQQRVREAVRSHHDNTH